MNLPNKITGTFNKNVTLQSGTVKVYKEGALFLTFTESDILLVGNYFEINIANLFPDNGSYLVVISSELFRGFAGTQWDFEIVDGYYNADFYNNNFYLTS